MDGLEVLVERSRLEEYYDIMNDIQEEFNLIWEHEQYTKIVYFNINSYVAITTSGKIKQKGQFVEKPELSNSVDELIIAKALTAYFIHDTPVKEFINNHTIIEDFCISKKVSKEFSVYWNGEKQQNLNRYYVSKKGAYLYYSKDDKKMNNLLKGFSVQLLNVLPDSFPTDVHKDYYIGKTLDLVNPFLQQGLF